MLYSPQLFNVYLQIFYFDASDVVEASSLKVFKNILDRYGWKTNICFIYNRQDYKLNRLHVSTIFPLLDLVALSQRQSLATIAVVV